MAFTTFFAIASSLFLQIAPIPREMPPPQVPAGRVLYLDSLKAIITIQDTTAVTELEQTFFNPSGIPVEESYLWPIPEGATVSDFQLWIDGKPQKAELLDKDKARAIYESIVRARRDPAILEWAGLGCVRASVFPVPPRSQGKVRLRYSTFVADAGSLLEYSLPLRLASVAPGGIRSFIIEGSIASQRPLANIYSPTHALDVRPVSPNAVRFSFESAGAIQPANFTLTVNTPASDVGALLLAHRAVNDAGFFTLSLTPRLDLAPGQALPKDVIFVFDTSGSMAGEKMEQARKGLLQCLGRLAPQDRFALVRFSTEAEQFRPQLCDTSKESLDAARGWIQKLEARGGTNIQEALDTALRISQQPDHIQMIFFLTDGLPTVGVTDKNQILASVRAKNTNNLRIFTFGVGFDVNTQLLDALSTESRAAREYVYPQEDVEVKVSALFDKVAFPVLSDVSIDGGAAGWFDVYPRALPDLFKGSAMIVTGRYRGAGKIPVRLSGKLGGARREYIYELHFPQVEEKYDTVPALWAGRKVGFLVDEIRLRGANPELIEEVRRLGREFNIITPYTSFLVVEEGRRLATARDDRLGFLPAGPETKDGAAESLKKFSDLDKQKSGEDAVELSLVTDLASNNGSTAQNAAPAAGRAALAGGGGGKLEATLRQNARNVGRRVFININNVWVDSRFTDKDRAGIVKIKFLSDEYFALLAKEPGLSSCLALGTRVVVNCKGVFYEVES